ncbi:MAG: hypothetical protein ACRBBU_02945 [Pseudooceanicola sp.]
MKRIAEGYFNGAGRDTPDLIQSGSKGVVTTAEPFKAQHDSVAWPNERAVLNLVGKFIAHPLHALTNAVISAGKVD